MYFALYNDLNEWKPSHTHSFPLLDEGLLDFKHNLGRSGLRLSWHLQRFILQDGREEGRKAEESLSRRVTQSTHSPKGKIRLLWDSAQEGVLSFDEKLFCKWICSYQAWRISEPPLFHYCWLMLRIHWVCPRNQIKGHNAWADMFFSKVQL